MITIEPMNGQEGCTANCATCPAPIKTLQGPRDDMDQFIKRFVALCENEHIPYVFSPTANIDQLITTIGTYGVTKATDIVSIAKFPETSIDTIRQVFDHMLTSFPHGRLTVGILDKGISISAAHRASINDIIDAFAQSALPFLLINLPNNYMHPELFNQSKKEFWESDEALYTEIKNRYKIEGRPLQVFRFNDQRYTHNYQSQGQFNFSKRKRLYVARRILAPIDPIAYNWELFRASAKEVLQELREQLHGAGHVEDAFLSPAPFGVRFQHQSFDSANPFLWFSYPEMNRILDECKKDLFHANDFFSAIEKHIDAGLHLRLEDHISTTDSSTILQVGELRSGLVYNR